MKRNYTHVLYKVIGSTNILQLSETNLSNNSPKFTAGSRDTMGGRTVTCWERFPGYSESSAIGAEVLEKISKAVEDDETLCGWWAGIKLVETEA